MIHMRYCRYVEIILQKREGSQQHQAIFDSVRTNISWFEKFLMSADILFLLE